jgi:dUTP pyrophosphatase
VNVVPQVPKLPLAVKRLHPSAKLPVYGSDGAGAFDVHAVLPGTTLMLEPGQSFLIPTGLAFAVPPSFLLMLNVRSGMGAKHGIRLRNTIGYIDPDYRGELMVCLENCGTEDYIIKHGERIAQCAIVLAPQAMFVEVDELPETPRGTGGFGSSGK